MADPKKPIVVEMYDDGYVKVHALEQHPDVSVVLVNRPYSEFDDVDAEISELIDKLVAKRLPYWHRKAYTEGWVVKTHLKERWDADRLGRVRADCQELAILDAAGE